MCLFLIIPFASGFSLKKDDTTFVGQNGWLQVIGTQLCNENREPIQLKGMSLYDVSFYDQYTNKDCFSWLNKDWGVNIIRGAMYTEYGGTYTYNPDSMKKAVQAAIDAGIYIIIDWHILTDGNPQKHKPDAIKFFKDMSKTYKDIPNVIYEICNEPNGNITWKDDVKPYAEELIPVIRANSPRSVILVGNTHWDHDYDIAADDPLNFKNIMYTCHFYQKDDGQSQRDKIDYALSKNAPIFASEWGVTDSTANGSIYPTDVYTWIKFLNDKKISWCNWSLSTILEASAALKPNTSAIGGWSDGDLTESGLVLKYLIKGKKTGPIFADNFDSRNFAGGRWTNNNARLSTKYKKSGIYSAILKKGSMMSKALPTEPYSNLKLSFNVLTKDSKSNDTLKLEWSNGTKWFKLEDIKPSANWQPKTYTLPKEAEGLANFSFRLTPNFHNDTSTAYIDDVIVSADRPFDDASPN